MPKKAISQLQFDALLDAYRNSPGVVRLAAAASGLDRRTAQKAWTKGLARFYAGNPIRDILQAEHVAARARLTEDAQKRESVAAEDRDKARVNAVESRKQEGQVVQLARANSLQALAATASMLQTARALASRVKEKLEGMLRDDAQATKDLEDGAGRTCDTCGHRTVDNQMNAGAIVNLVDRITGVGRRVNELAHLAMQMERLHLGEPGQIIGLVDASAGDAITLPEAKARLAVAAQAIEAAERRELSPKPN
jgi:uncharacterized membrane protein